MQLLVLRKRRMTRKLLTDLQMNLAFGMLLIQNLMNTHEGIILFVCVLNSWTIKTVSVEKIKIFEGI